MIGVSSSTVAAIIARCSSRRCPIRASLPTALRRFPGSPRPASSSPAPPRRARPAGSTRRSARRADRPACVPAACQAPSTRRPCAALRQYVKCDVYSPSRRSSSPTSPGRVQASASARILALYSAVNERRLACSTSSGSDTCPGPEASPARRARRPRTPARLRRAGLRGRRQQPQPLPQLHSCSSPCPAFSVLALKVHRYLDGERLAGR